MENSLMRSHCSHSPFYWDPRLYKHIAAYNHVKPTCVCTTCVSLHLIRSKMGQTESKPSKGQLSPAAFFCSFAMALVSTVLLLLPERSCQPVLNAHTHNAEFYPSMHCKINNLRSFLMEFAFVSLNEFKPALLNPCRIFGRVHFQILFKDRHNWRMLFNHFYQPEPDTDLHISS